MELELRQQLHDNCGIEHSGSRVKEKALKKIASNEDVLIYWSMISVNWEVEEADVLLKIIIEH